MRSGAVASGSAALALTALGSRDDLVQAGRLQRELWAADVAPAALQLLQRRAGDAPMACKAAALLAKAAGGNPAAQVWRPHPVLLPTES